MPGALYQYGALEQCEKGRGSRRWPREPRRKTPESSSPHASFPSEHKDTWREEPCGRSKVTENLYPLLQTTASLAWA
jgi:hypothetical protein